MQSKILRVLVAAGAFLLIPSVQGGFDGMFTSVLNDAQLEDGMYSGSQAFGRVRFNLDGRDSVLCYEVTVNGLEGLPGQAVLFPRASRMSHDSRLRSFSGDPSLDCVGPLTLEEQRALAKGAYVLGLTSDRFPDGEIAGQVVKVSEVSPVVPDIGQSKRLDLDAREMYVLQELLEMDSDAFYRLAAEINQNGVAYLEIESSGSADAPLASGNQQRIEITQGDINKIADAVEGAFNTAISWLETTAGNIWGGVQDIGETLDAELRLGETFETVSDTFEKTLKLLLELRDGYEDFNAGAFRGQVKSFFSDMQSIADRSNDLLCVGSFPTVQTDSEFLRTAIDLTPDVLLYIMSKAFDAISPGWQEIPATLLGPLNSIGDLCAPISSALTQSSDGAVTKQAWAVPQMCELEWLDTQDTYVAAISLRGGGLLATLIFKGIAACVPRDKVIVAAGEGATVYANPWRSGLTVLGEISNIVSSVGDFLLTSIYRCQTLDRFDALDGQLGNIDETVSATQQTVLEVQTKLETLDKRDIELSLQRCDPLVSLVLPRSVGGQIEDVDELVQELIENAIDAGFNTKNAARFADRARQSALELGDYRSAFQSYCQAYNLIVTGQANNR